MNLIAQTNVELKTEKYNYSTQNLLNRCDFQRLFFVYD